MKQGVDGVTETDARFRAIADSAPVLLWMSGTDSSYTFFNKGWLDFTGRPLEQELGDGWSKGVHPDDVDRCLRTYVDAFDGRQAFEMEYRLRRHDGVYRWILARGVPRCGPNGTFVGYIGSAYDITELKEAEERPRLVLEAAPNGMIMISPEGAITYVNAAVEAIFGYAREELIGRPIETLVPTMGAGRELFSRRKDGSEVPVEIGLTPIEASGGPIVLLSIIDITTRRNSERALADAARQTEHEKRILDAVIENLPGVFFMVDRQRRMVRWNKERERMTGYSAEEIRTLPRGDQTAPEDRDNMLAAVERGFREGRTRSEHRMLTKDGRRIPLVAQGSTVKIGDEEYLLGVAVDVSALKQVEEELRGALVEIQELKGRLELENAYLRQEITVNHRHEGFVGESKAIRQVLNQVEQVAGTRSTVLVLGETGAGKELVAHAIHRLSPRQGRPLVKVNCAGLPSGLVESELFGREKGAYTGALTRQAGRFEVADKSTIFLDEIGELPLELQAKLLRVLQDGEFERLGSGTTIKVDVRVIAATNRDLAREVRAGRFREDLYYRMNVFPIQVPPLRDRRDDIASLVWAFVRELEATMGKRIESIPRKALEALVGYSWPGNVRELRNVIERAMIISCGPVLSVEVPSGVASASAENAGSPVLEDVERRHIVAVLERTRWRVRGPGGAAGVLGLKPTTLESRMTRLGIKRPPDVPGPV
jgi:PAS domain S-box-containing protein